MTTDGTHPLFPAFTSDDAKEKEGGIIYVYVTRLNTQTGKYDWCPTKFQAGELRGVDQIHARFGGGTYQLIARNDKHVVSRSEEFPLPGPERPLVPEPEGPKAPAVATQGLPTMPAVQMPAPTNTSEALMMGMFQFMAATMQQNTALVLGMMQNDQARQERAAQETRLMYEQTMNRMVEISRGNQAAPQQSIDAQDKRIADWLEVGMKLGAARGGAEVPKEGVNFTETVKTVKEALATGVTLATEMKDLAKMTGAVTGGAAAPAAPNPHAQAEAAPPAAEGAKAA